MSHNISASSPAATHHRLTFCISLGLFAVTKLTKDSCLVPASGSMNTTSGINMTFVRTFVSLYDYEDDDNNDPNDNDDG